MGLNLKKLFIKDDKKEDKKEVIPQQPTNVKQWGDGNINNLTNTSQFFPQNTVGGNTDYVKHFEDVIESAPQQGNGFREFMKAIKQLDSLPLSEQQKYIATYPTYSNSGVTAMKLVESGQFYIGLVQKEKQEFEASLNSENVNIAQKEQQVVKEQEEINKLTEQIQQRANNIQKLNQEIQTDKNSLSLENTAFTNAFGNKMNQLNDSINKIKTYLNGTTTQ